MHTPGPWTYMPPQWSSHDGADFYPGWISAMASDGLPVELVVVESATDDDMWLMAAAPDLLAACEAANASEWLPPDVREIIEATIAKVRNDGRPGGEHASN